jgi:hypothetical protein
MQYKNSKSLWTMFVSHKAQKTYILFLIMNSYKISLLRELHLFAFSLSPV